MDETCAEVARKQNTSVSFGILYLVIMFMLTMWYNESLIKIVLQVGIIIL